MQTNELRAAPRNPSTAEIRLHCLDMAVRGALLTGRANDFQQQAQQYFEWVTGGLEPSRAAQDTPASLTVEQILARVPKGMLRTAAELKEKGLNRAELIAAAKPPAASTPAADLEDEDEGEQAGQGGGGDGRGPASLRQAGG
jgi:hypothetical protein